LRRAFAEELRIVKGASGVVDGDFAEDRGRERFAKQKNAGFKKLRDTPRGLVINRKQEERARNLEKRDEPV
jgi:hypothetical protein